MNKSYEEVIQFIKHGKENAIHCPDIARAIGSDERAVQAHILAARLDRVPILSDRGGYFLPGKENGEQECKRFIEGQTRRAKTSFSSIRAAKVYLRTCVNQQGICDIMPHEA